jgi:hypothetical protein
VEWNVATISVRKAREYVHWACALYWVEPPSVKTHGGKASSYSNGLVIDFNYGHLNRAIALHEVAHHICNAIFPLDMPAHGPEWLSVYLWLLAEAKVAPKTALLASAKAAGLKWMPLWVISPKRLAKPIGGLKKSQLRPPIR